MIKLLNFLILFLFSSILFAKPTGFYLVTPTKLNLKDNKTLLVTYNLPCSNPSAADWSRIVTSYDDSGDARVVVGIIAAESSCSGDGNFEFTDIVNIEKRGFNPDKNGTTFEKMIIKK